MTVAEAIAELQKLPPDLPLLIWAQESEANSVDKFELENAIEFPGGTFGDYALEEMYKSFADKYKPTPDKIIKVVVVS